MNFKKIICLSMIFISSLCILTGCEKEKQIQNSSENKEKLVLDRSYITRFADINEITYPKFVFNYPANWKVVNEQVNDFSETVTIMSEDGNEITYNYMNLSDDVNLGNSSSDMLKVDVSELSKSSFNPSYVQATDYSSLGSFMVSKLHVIGQLDMQSDTDYKKIDGSISYAVLPQSMSGIKSDVRGPFSGEFSFGYGGRISIICTPQEKLNEKQENEVIEILKSFRTLEDAKETYINGSSENVLTLSQFLDNEEPIFMYYFNFDNLYNRKDITLHTKVDTLSKILVFENEKVNAVSITQTFDDWQNITVEDILSLTDDEIIKLSNNENCSTEKKDFIITGTTLENKDILEKEKIWFKLDDNTIQGVPDLVTPIELKINNNYYAGFWKSDIRGSEVMIFKTDKNKYFTFDDKKDILLNPSEDEIKNALK